MSRCVHPPRLADIPSYRSHEYVEVREIYNRTADGNYKTRSKGFAHRDRPKGENEEYSSISTSLTKLPRLVLNLI